MGQLERSWGEYLSPEHLKVLKKIKRDIKREFEVEDIIYLKRIKGGVNESSKRAS